MRPPARVTGPLRELALWGLRRRRRYRVAGGSMAPAYRDGDHILVDPRAYGAALPPVGEVVLVRHPFRHDVTMVKRVAGYTEQGRIRLEGDDPRESTDSRSLGTVAPSDLVGRVVLRLG